MKILDVGCGPGSITIGLARHVPQGHVVGLDIASASAALEKARVRAAREGVANVAFQTGDGHALPFADGTFDVAHSHQVLQSSHAPVQFLRELARVTRPGGLVASCAWDTGSWVVHPMYDGITQFREMTGRVRADSGVTWHAGRNLHVWARQAGLDPARVKVSTCSPLFRAPEERAYFGGVFKAICRDSEFTSVALEKGYVTKGDVEKMVEGWQKWTDDEDALSSVIHFEILCHK